MAKTTDDLNVLKNLPDIHIWGEDIEKFGKINLLKGKFVITSDGKFIAKLFTVDKWDRANFFHNMLLEELGVEKPESAEIKKEIIGGGKIEIEMVGDYVECKLSGKSGIYGHYNKSDIDIARMERAIEATFHLGMMPILVIPDFEYINVNI